MSRALFGPSGNPEAFYEEGHKKSLEMPAWVRAMGLDTYEYQCAKGVKISPATAKELGEKAREAEVTLSIHAPYYLNLATDGERRQSAVDYIIQTMHAATWMGADRIVVHTGACAKISREEALSLAKDTMRLALKTADELGLGEVHICPETMGKINQLGTPEEVFELCRLDERLIPCIDFGHVHARSIGTVSDYEDFKGIFDTLENMLGRERAKSFHSHMSRIEYTQKGGEKKHWRYEDTQFGPDFDPIARLIFEREMSPRVICESAGTQGKDARIFKDIYESFFTE